MNTFKTFGLTSLLVAGLIFASCGKAESSSNQDSNKQDKAISAETAGLLPLERAVDIPEWSITTLKGETISLSSLKGKVVIIDFWDTWCPPCKKGIPELIELHDEYSSKDVVIIGMALGRDGEEKVKSFAKKTGINYHVAIDNNYEMTKMFGGIQSIPTAFVIDKNGKGRAMHVGYTPKSKFEKQIKALI